MDVRDGPGRRVPFWAAALIERLTRDGVGVVSVASLAPVVDEVLPGRDVRQVIARLQELGWLRGLKRKGTWVFVPPGMDDVADPYLDLRAWRVRDPDDVFLLAGASAAWHLGYLDRAPARPTIWVEDRAIVPSGLRGQVLVTTTRFPESQNRARQLGPSTRLLRRRGLDVLAWAADLGGFGPEALLVQIASRPAGFGQWADLAAHLDEFVHDVDVPRTDTLLRSATRSARRRAGYLLAVGGRRDDGRALLPTTADRSVTTLGAQRHVVDDAGSVWDADFAVVDRIVAPLTRVLGKA